MQDCVVVGCGPVGALLALRLATAGWDVVLLDREAEPFPLPRGVAADGEVLELLERAAPSSTEGFLRDPPVRFLAADGSQTGRLRFPVPGLAFFRQPVLEQRLVRAAVAAGVHLRRGVQMVGLSQTDDAVTVRLADGSAVGARWAVGCDGAASTVRHCVDAGWRGRDLPHRWLVCDVVGPPVPGRQLFTYTCDPARPQVDLPVPGGHRWEWLLRDGDAREVAGRGWRGGAAGGSASDPSGGIRPSSLARDLLARDADPSSLEVVRAVEYRFSARRAQRWRTGRVLLAGDAAHTMPPFAGQGLGAGLRDAWALGALLPPAAAPSDLDRYQQLREPHLRRTTALSLLLGAVLQTGSSRRAAARDVLLRRAFTAPLVGPWLRRGGPRPDRSGVLDL